MIRHTCRRKGNPDFNGTIQPTSLQLCIYIYIEIEIEIEIETEIDGQLFWSQIRKKK
jgi:hypothetical protein